jgi:hypothetical protein
MFEESRAFKGGIPKSKATGEQLQDSPSICHFVTTNNAMKKKLDLAENPDQKIKNPLKTNRSARRSI